MFLLVLLFTGCNRAPYSSPTALRDTNAYTKAISPAPPTVIDLAALDQITVALDGETLVATMPSSSGSEDPSDGFAHTFKRLAPGEKLQGDGATFEMVAFSVSGPGISPTPTNGQNYVPLEFFALDGKPLTKEELKALGFPKWQLTEYVDNSSSYIGEAFPEVKVWLGSRKQPPGYFTPVGCFDARTRHQLTSGNSWSQIANGQFGYAELRPRLWHATPMEFVVDVELDGKVVVETNAVAGMAVTLPGGVVRLLGIWDGGSQSWSSQTGSASGTQETRIKLRDRENETNAVALFVTEPPKLAVHLELLDAQGKEFSVNGGGTSGGMRMVGIRGRAAEVKEVRLTVFTNHHRVVLTLPPIANLPTAGLPVANLFEVPMPRVVIQQEHELREVIGGVTQLRFPYPPGGDRMPASLFPMTLTNVTAAELLELYRQNMTNTLTVVVDGQKQEIRVEPTRFEKVNQWVTQKLRM